MQGDPAADGSPDQPAPPFEGLWIRIASALVLAVVAFGLAFAGLLPFAALVLVVALAMSWEWSRLVRGDGFDLTLAVHGLCVAVAVVLAAAGFVALGVAVLLIGTIIVLALEFGAHPVVSAAGVMYAGLPAVALLWLRSSEPLGFTAILFIVVIVAVTDTAAFLAGRLIGGPRLAPRISPNKTWSGLTGGVLAATLAAAVFAIALGNPPLPVALAGLLMALVAQAGDLGESALKRAFGAKDASHLLPGHGGFMDRMDGLVAVSIAVAIAVLFVDPRSPAQALLAGLPLASP
jgi:phosphatidate cytidylyltransferase